MGGGLRAVSEMMLGGFLFECKCVLNQVHMSRYINIVFSIIKYLIYGLAIVYALGFIKKSSAMHLLFYLSFGILMSFSEIGICIKSSKLSRLLGKMSYDIYLLHGIGIYVVNSLFNKQLSNRIIIVTCLTIIVIAIPYEILASKIVKLLKKGLILRGLLRNKPIKDV